ncbi:hypothetical protein JCM8208_006931 [Rhodotorula glutinis]
MQSCAFCDARQCCCREFASSRSAPAAPQAPSPFRERALVLSALQTHLSGLRDALIGADASAESRKRVRKRPFADVAHAVATGQTRSPLGHTQLDVPVSTAARSWSARLTPDVPDAPPERSQVGKGDEAQSAPPPPTRSSKRIRREGQRG